MDFMSDGGFVSWQEYAVGLAVAGDRRWEGLERFAPVLDMEVGYIGRPVRTVVLDASGDVLTVQLLLPEKRRLDCVSGDWASSEIRAFLNSDEFVSRFDPGFARLVRPRSVPAGQSEVLDMFWLLSHEETGSAGAAGCWIPNAGAETLAAFDGTNGARLGRVNDRVAASWWWLRSRSVFVGDCAAAVWAASGEIELRSAREAHYIFPACRLRLP